MDATDRLVEHDLWFTNRLLDKAKALPEDELDKPVLSNAPRLYGSGELTLRVILNAMVANKENWVASVKGLSACKEQPKTVDALNTRLSEAGTQFQQLVRDIKHRGQWDEGFVDALCEPPQSFTYGGMLAHVVTFSTYRRNLAIMAFRELGVTDLGIGDPIEWERSLA